MKDPLGDKADSKPQVVAEKKEEKTGDGDTVNTGNTSEESISAIGEKNIADPNLGGDGSRKAEGQPQASFVDPRELTDEGYGPDGTTAENSPPKQRKEENKKETKTL